MAKRLFEGSKEAADYLKYRPQWPTTTRDAVMEYLTEKLPPPHTHAVDVGCGSGQFTQLLCDKFDHVTGVDISENQIKWAKKADKTGKILYKVYNVTENIPVDSNSVELVTAAEAVHWFDLEWFFQEAARVLKPNGALALLGYGRCIPGLGQRSGLSGDAEKTQIEEEMRTIVTEFLKKCIWQKANDHITNSYRDLNIPEHSFYDIKRNDSLEIRCAMSLPEYCCFLSTYSSYQTYLNMNPQEDILETVREKLYAAMKTDQAPEDINIDVRFPVFILLGRKK